MFSEETDWLHRFRAAGLEGAVLPGRRGGARRRRLARRAAQRREPARHPALPRQAPRRARGRARAAAAALVAAARAGCVFRGERGRRYRDGARFLASGDVRSLLAVSVRRPHDGAPGVSEYLRLAFGTVRRARARLARGAGARPARRVGDARLGARGRVRRVGGDVRRARLDRARARRAARDRRRRGRARGAAPVRRGHGRSGRRPCSAAASCSGCCSGASSGVVAGDGLFHLARVRKLVELGDLHLRTVDEFADGGLHPGYAFPLWHGFLALVAKVSGLDPTRGDEPRGLAARADRVPRRVRGRASPSSARRPPGSRCSPRRSRSTASPPATAARTRRSRCRGRRRASCSCPAAFALFFLWVVSRRRGRPRRARGRVRRARARAPDLRALRADPARAATRSSGCDEWRGSGLALAAATVPTVLAFALAAAARARHRLARSRPGREGARAPALRAACSSSARPTSYRLAAERRRAAPARSRSPRSRSCRSPGSPCAAGAGRAFVLGGTVARARADARAGALHALLRRGLALAVAPRRRLRPVRVRLRRRARARSRGRRGSCRSRSSPGSSLQHWWPGDFEYGLRHGGPGVVTWWAFVGGAVALVLGLVFGGGSRRSASGTCSAPRRRCSSCCRSPCTASATGRRA